MSFVGQLLEIKNEHYIVERQVELFDQDAAWRKDKGWLSMGS